MKGGEKMLRKNQLLSVGLIALLIVAIAGCSSLPGLGDMTPKQNATWMNNVYARQYDLYLDQILLSSISAAERLQLKGDPSLIKPEMLRTNFAADEAKVLKAKRDIFIQVHPMLKAYNEVVIAGGVPSAELEYQLVQLINTLLAYVD